MTPGAPYFYDAQLQLLRRNGPVVMYLRRREPVRFTSDPGPFNSVLVTTDRITFRHSSDAGDPVEALRDLLAPFLGVWMEQAEEGYGSVAFRLQAAIVGDAGTCNAQMTAHAGVAAAPGARAAIGAQLLDCLCELLVERIFTGQ